MKIINDGYVDDALSGGSLEEVEKMKSEVTKNEDGSLSYSGTVSQILDTVGLTPKMIVQSGETDPDILAKLGEKVLGHVWNPTDDTLQISLPINITPRVKNVPSGPDLTADNLDTLKDYKPTKRSVLSVTNSFYDPTGIIAAYLLKFKLEHISLEGKRESNNIYI